MEEVLGGVIILVVGSLTNLNIKRQIHRLLDRLFVGIDAIPVVKIENQVQAVADHLLPTIHRGHMHLLAIGLVNINVVKQARLTRHRDRVVNQFAKRMGWKMPTPPSDIEMLAKQFTDAAHEERKYDNKTGKPYRSATLRISIFAFTRDLLVGPTTQ